MFNRFLQHQTAIQHSRWILQGGWKKKTVALTLVLGSVAWIYNYTLNAFASDSLLAELEMAENEVRQEQGRVPVGYNITQPSGDDEFE